MNNRTVEKKSQNKNGILRAFFVLISLLAEVGFWYILFVKVNDAAPIINIISRILALMIVLGLYSQK